MPPAACADRRIIVNINSKSNWKLHSRNTSLHIITDPLTPQYRNESEKNAVELFEAIEVEKRWRFLHTTCARRNSSCTRCPGRDARTLFSIINLICFAYIGASLNILELSLVSYWFCSLSLNHSWHVSVVLAQFNLMFVCLQQQQQWWLMNPFHDSHSLLHHVKNDHQTYVFCVPLHFFQMQNAEWQTNRILLSARRANECTMCVPLFYESNQA